MAVAVSGPHTFRGGYNTRAVSVVVVIIVVTFVVTTFVSAEGLSCGEGLVTDGALVGPAGGGGDAGRSGGGGGGVVVGEREFPVAGLVSAESLVGGEGFFANGAFVGELGGRIWGWGGGGGGGAAGEHDEAESEVLFFGRVVAGTLGTLAFCPWNGWVVKGERWNSCCGGVESFQSHEEKVDDDEEFWFGLNELGVRVGEEGL